MNELQDKLKGLSEKELTKRVVIPLLQKIHGRTEYTCSADEAGRDVVSFGQDYLGRLHVLVVQVRRSKLSHSAKFLGPLLSELQVARREPVTLQDGNTVLPHEVWFVTPHPFAEQRRRQSPSTLSEFGKSQIKLVDGDELVAKVQEHLPRVVDVLLRGGRIEEYEAISELLMHREAFAFDITERKSIDQFYVTTAIANCFSLGLRAASGLVSIVRPEMHDLPVQVWQRRSRADVVRNWEDTDWWGTLLDEVLDDWQRERPWLAEFGISVEADYGSAIEVGMDVVAEWVEGLDADYLTEIRNSAPVFTDSLTEAFNSESDHSDGFHDVFSVLSCWTDLSEVYSELQSAVQQSLIGCPETLGGNELRIVEIQERVEELERLLTVLAADGIDVEEKPGAVIRPRVLLDDPTGLVNLGRDVLVSGPPGCGKTTALRVLAARLLELGQQVLYVPCHAISTSGRVRCSLWDLAKAHSLTHCRRNARAKEIVLILDGLDEAQEELPRLLSSNKATYRCIVASARTAYLRNLQLDAFHVTLSPFTESERDQFICEWIGPENRAHEQAKAGLRRHRDLDLHTRLPLVATLYVGLLKHGYRPKTRVDIYEQRLQLLLEKWPAVKGVTNMRVDNPKEKLDFLMSLAFALHSAPGRRRAIGRDELHDVYERSLGNWGYTASVEDFIDDLVTRNGVLFQIQEDRYTLGHLTFQEHLAARHIFKHPSECDVAAKLGNDWWREPLNFYAGMSERLDHLIDETMKSEAFISHSEQLSEMLLYAEYTSPGAVHCVREIHPEASEVLRRRASLDEHFIETDPDYWGGAIHSLSAKEREIGLGEGEL